MYNRRHVHLELRAISHELNTMFEVQQCCELGTYFIFLLSTVIWTYEFTIIVHFDIWSKMKMILLMYSWCFVYATKLFSINHVYETVSLKANTTIRIIDKVINSTCDIETRKEAMQLTLQILQKPLRFTGMGLFHFGNELIRRFFVFLTTMVVVLLQMGAFPWMYFYMNIKINQTDST